jgi:ankyrin repeat protein
MHLALLKADVNARDRFGQTPLHFSVNLDDTEMVNLLLDWGSDPSIEDEEGQTPESLGIWQLAAAREEGATARGV